MPKRGEHKAAFKARDTLEPLKGEQTIAAADGHAAPLS